MCDRLTLAEDEGSVGICHGITRGITPGHSQDRHSLGGLLALIVEGNASSPLWPIPLPSAAATQQIESGFARQNSHRAVAAW